MPQRKILGAPMQLSKGNKDKMFPKCSGPDCWCRVCVYDSIDMKFEPYENWSSKDEKAFEYASNALKRFYISSHTQKQ